MLWGYGYEAMWWMLLTMVISSAIGIIVVGALIWIVLWAVSWWRRGRQARMPEDLARHAPSVRTAISIASSYGAGVSTEAAGDEERSQVDACALTHSRR